MLLIGLLAASQEAAAHHQAFPVCNWEQDNGDRARLYAGAGIAAGSDPDKEFAEVQLKLQALLKALV
ncbi:MAG: hypothetical protein RMY00_18965 [Nostoc sp. ChiVER01]|nr:hypothetical protein [Nostoc sp. ChiVER01]MDZ8225044.1 hypothetical protein [Nostoc sp. ChiVER01]